MVAPSIFEIITNALHQYSQIKILQKSYNTIFLFITFFNYRFSNYNQKNVKKKVKIFICNLLDSQLKTTYTPFKKNCYLKTVEILEFTFERPIIDKLKK